MTLQDQLHELFLLDQQVRGLRGRLDAALRRQRAQQNRLDQQQQQRQELQSQFQHSQAKVHSLEQEVAEIDQRVDTLRQRMNNVTSDKEYSALLVEVNTLRNQKSKLEDQTLEHMNEVDSLNQRLAEIDEKIQQQQKLVAGAETEAEAARNEVGEKLEQLTSQRQEAAARIPDDALQTFERLAESYEGEAMAGIIEENRRRMEYTCAGCYMSLPIERVSALMSKPDTLVTCPTCNRILYIDQELKGALSPSE